MCLNCGCGDPYDNHGNDKNLVWDDIVRASEPDKLTPADVLQNITETVKKVPAAELEKKRGV